MKTFQMNITEVIALISCTSIGFGVVTGFVQKYKAADSREYLIETENKYNWFQAFHECARRNSQLVIIESEEKNTALVNVLKKAITKTRNIWLGGNDQFNITLDNDRPFFWSATGKEFTFTNWLDNEPNNNKFKEHCVQIYANIHSYQWNDNDCNFEMGFICEVNSNVRSKCNEENKNKSISDISLNELNTRLQTLKQLIKDKKSETGKLKNSIESAVEKLVDQQQLTVNNWREKLQKTANELNKQITQSTEKLNGSIPSRYEIKNVVIINQGK